MGWLGAGAALSLLVVGCGAQRPGGQGAGGLHGRRLGTPPDALPNDGISHERRQRRRQHGGGPNSRPNGGSGGLGLGAGVSRLSPLQNVSVVVVTDLGTRRWLRAAQCTWLQLLDPGQVVTVTDFDLTAGAGLQGGCGFQVAHPLRVANAVDYLEVGAVFFWDKAWTELLFDKKSETLIWRAHHPRAGCARCRDWQSARGGGMWQALRSVRLLWVKIGA